MKKNNSENHNIDDRLNDPLALDEIYETTKALPVISVEEIPLPEIDAEYTVFAANFERLQALCNRNSLVYLCVMSDFSASDSINSETVLPDVHNYVRTGVAGRIKGVTKVADDQIIINFRGLDRCKALGNNLSNDGYGHTDIELIPFKDLEEPIVNSEEVQFKIRAQMGILADMYADLRPKDKNGMLPPLYDDTTSYPVTLLSTILYNIPLANVGKAEVISHHTYSACAEALMHHLNDLGKLMEMKNQISEKVKHELDDQQRQNFIQSQIHHLQMMANGGEEEDVAQFNKRAASKHWTDATKAHYEREVAKLLRLAPGSPDYSVQYAYLDTMLNLPWMNYSNDEFNLADVEARLDADHFGLEKVKERIVEHMAVIRLRKDLRAPILCLVGPPGVGKTSLGKSIAAAMGREYARIAFGGMHDEAEVRGHRRTYIGAMPGRILSSLEKCKTSNPVMMLDEIDKIGQGLKGDPAQALLEVLDPEQNNAFHDNYLDTDYDLSKVLFIATANSLATISQPLLDRMEIIAIPGYITAEKTEIARTHLIPKLLREHGFEENEIGFNQESLEYAVDRYTRESGVRKLEKTLAKILRKIAVLKVKGEVYPREITKPLVKTYLGKEEVSPEMYENNDYTGVVTGLAWTQVGGEILFIESSVTPGKGKLTLTGNLGDVMKESATIALEFLKAHSGLLGKTSEDIAAIDVHVHVPEGAIPKDGPSAGITMATSIASAITGRKVKNKLAMTGEITLRGKVLPVGGIKEKIIAAKRAGIKEIILSVENQKDILEVQPRYLSDLQFIYVHNIEEVLTYALLP